MRVDACIARSVVPTERGRAARNSSAGMRGAIHVAFEEGTQAQWLLRSAGARRRSGRRLQSARPDAAGQQRRSRRTPTSCRICSAAGGCGRSITMSGDRGGAEGTGADVSESGRGRHARDAAAEGAVPRARRSRRRGRRVSARAARGMAAASCRTTGVRFRAEVLYAELEVLQDAAAEGERRRCSTEARRDPAWRVLRTIPYLGPVRVALLLATMQTPWRFRTKRQSVGVCRLRGRDAQRAPSTNSMGGRVRAPAARADDARAQSQSQPDGQRMCSRARATAAATRCGPLQDFYQAMLARRDARGTRAR